LTLLRSGHAAERFLNVAFRVLGVPLEHRCGVRATWWHVDSLLGLWQCFELKIWKILMSMKGELFGQVGCLLWWCHGSWASRWTYVWGPRWEIFKGGLKIRPKSLNLPSVIGFEYRGAIVMSNTNPSLFSSFEEEALATAYHQNTM
jgi:hypothetical protein